VLGYRTTPPIGIADQEQTAPMRDCLPVTRWVLFTRPSFVLRPPGPHNHPLVRPAILGKQSGAIMKRKSKKTVKHQTAKMLGVAWMGLAVMIMVSIVGAVYWLNPKDNAVRNDGTPAAQNATKLSPTRATTGSGKFD
jgi:hypothetical protein